MTKRIKIKISIFLHFPEDEEKTFSLTFFERINVRPCGCVSTRRLAKSTLLLIPLFGVNYMVFVYLMEPPEKNMKRIKIFFDLGLGSFQVRWRASFRRRGACF